MDPSHQPDHQPIPKLTTGQEKALVTWLLQTTAYLLLADAPLDDVTKQNAERVKNKALAHLSSEDRKPLYELRDTITRFARLLAKCETTKQLELSQDYLDRLLNGEVWIVEDQAVMPEGYQTNAQAEERAS